MNKKIAHQRFVYFGLLFSIFLLPFFVQKIASIFLPIYISTVIAVALFQLLGLMFLISLVIFYKYPNHESISLKSAKIEMYSKYVLALLIPALFYYQTVPLMKDVAGLISEQEFEIQAGEIRRLSRPAYGLFVKYQSLRIDSVSEPYYFLFSSTWLRTGDEIEFKYLPNTRYVIEVDNLTR